MDGSRSRLPARLGGPGRSRGAGDERLGDAELLRRRLTELSDPRMGPGRARKRLQPSSSTAAPASHGRRVPTS